MKNLFLTVAESGSTAFTDFLNALGQMRFEEIISKYGEKLLWAAITLIVGCVLTNWVLRIVMRRIEKSEFAAGTTKFIHGVVAFLLYFLVILTAASILGIPVTSVLTIFSVFTLAFSLAIKDIIALFASGITIIASKPFAAGDFVEIPEENISGFVAEVGLIHTHLFTADNKEIIIPNSIVAADTLINYSKIGVRRLDAVYSVSHKADFEKAKEIIKNIVENEPLVEKDKEPFISVTAITLNSVDIVCKCYVKWDNYETLRCTLNEKVKKAFDENNIEIPFAQMDIHMK